MLAFSRHLVSAQFAAARPSWARRAGCAALREGAIRGEHLFTRKEMFGARVATGAKEATWGEQAQGGGKDGGRGEGARAQSRKQPRA